LDNLKPSPTSSIQLNVHEEACYAAMNDDFNTSILIAELFEMASIINSANDGKMSLTENDINGIKKLMHDFVFDVLGLQAENLNTSKNKALNGVMEIILNIRKEIKSKKDFAASDKLRDDLSKIHISIKDTKDGATWSVEE